MLNNLKNPEKQLSQEQAASMMQEYMRLVEIERRFASMLGDRVLLRWCIMQLYKMAGDVKTRSESASYPPLYLKMMQ